MKTFKQWKEQVESSRAAKPDAVPGQKQKITFKQLRERIELHKAKSTK